MKVLCIISLCSWAHSFWKVLTTADWGTAKCLCVFVSWTSVPDTAWHLFYSAFGSWGNTSASGNTDSSGNKQWPKEDLRKQDLPLCVSLAPQKATLLLQETRASLTVSCSVYLERKYNFFSPPLSPFTGTFNLHCLLALWVFRNRRYNGWKKGN